MPFAILGYSLGCPLCFDLCRNNLTEGKPLIVFFCAEGSLKKIGSKDSPLRFSDDELEEKMILLGGIDNRVLNNKSMLDEVLAVIKNDYNVFNQFEFHNEKISYNSTIIYSPNDPTSFDMDDWKEITTGIVDYYTVGENHFFVNKNYREMADIINKKLEPFIV